MNPQFWRGKKVLITGHTGFKGGWLSLWLQSLGAEVSGYSRMPPTNPSLFEVASVGSGMNSTIGDIQNLDALRAAFAEYKPEIVIHMAAQPLVRYSYRYPIETYATNVLGTANVFEAVRESNSVRVVISVTSDKCYENKEWSWGYRETDPLGGHDPYSSSKACAEIITAAYRSSYFSDTTRDRHKVALASVRAGNVIGGGDWAQDRLIPDLIQSVIAERCVIIRNPHSIRPWQHVLEPLCGYLTVAERLWAGGPEFAQSWNFGPADDDAKPVSWMATELTQLWGNGARWQKDDQAHVHEASYLKLDSSKSRSQLGWAPRLSLKSALEWVVEWYRAHSRNEDMRALTELQIETFQNLQPGETRVVTGTAAGAISEPQPHN